MRYKKYFDQNSIEPSRLTFNCFINRRDNKSLFLIVELFRLIEMI